MLSSDFVRPASVRDFKAALAVAEAELPKSPDHKGGASFRSTYNEVLIKLSKCQDLAAESTSHFVDDLELRLERCFAHSRRGGSYSSRRKAAAKENQEPPARALPAPKAAEAHRPPLGASPGNTKPSPAAGGAKDRSPRSTRSPGTVNEAVRNLHQRMDAMRVSSMAWREVRGDEFSRLAYLCNQLCYFPIAW